MKSRYKNKKRRRNKTMKFRGGSSSVKNDNIMNVALQIIDLIDSSHDDKVHKLNKVYQLSKIIIPNEVSIYKGPVVVAETRPVNPSNNISGKVAEATPITNQEKGEIKNSLVAHAEIVGSHNNTTNNLHPKAEPVPQSTGLHSMNNLGDENDNSSREEKKTSNTKGQNVVQSVNYLQKNIEELGRKATTKLSDYSKVIPNKVSFQNDFKELAYFMKTKYIRETGLEQHRDLWSIYNIFLYLNNIFNKIHPNNEDMKKIMNNINDTHKKDYADVINSIIKSVFPLKLEELKEALIDILNTHSNKAKIDINDLQSDYTIFNNLLNQNDINVQNIQDSDFISKYNMFKYLNEISRTDPDKQIKDEAYELIDDNDKSDYNTLIDKLDPPNKL